MFRKPQKSAWQIQQERTDAAIKRARATRKLEAKEHKYLDPRPVEAWNHSSTCRRCERKKR